MINCDNGTLSISWSAVPGAITYTATLEELTGGTPRCCTSSATGCDIGDLPCGDMYILHVTAEGRTCNSSESDGIITRTGVHPEMHRKHFMFCKESFISDFPVLSAVRSGEPQSRSDLQQQCGVHVVGLQPRRAALHRDGGGRRRTRVRVPVA